jgi:hypothetical protein
LVFYPLTDRKRQKRIDRMIGDLSYAEPIGREAALELLNVAFVKFPSVLLSGIGEMVFVPLVARLASEEDRRVRAVCGAAIKVLLSRVDKETQSNLFGICAQWAEKKQDSGEHHSLAAAAVQVLGFFAETGRCPKSDRARGLALLQRGLLEDVGAAAAHASEGEWLMNAAEQQEKHARRDGFVYQSCLSLERFCAVEKKARLEDMFGNGGLLSCSSLCALVRYAHVWVRASVSRLINVLLVQHSLMEHRWSSSDRTALIDAFCDTLSEIESEAAVDKNAVSSVLRNILACLNSVSPHSQKQQEQEVAATPSPRAKRLKSLVVADADDREDSSEEAEDKSRLALVDVVLSRLSAIAVKGPFVVKAGVLQAVTGVLVRLEPGDAASMLSHVLTPLYRVAPWDQEDARGGEESAPQEIVTLCDQILKALRNHVGVTAFASAANAVREGACNVGRAKMQKQAASFVTNPVQANQKKLKMMEKKKGRK